MAWDANDRTDDRDDGGRLGRFIANVRALWPRYRTTDDEIRERIWPRMRHIDRQTLGEIIVQHGREYPDAIGPNWEIIRRMVGERVRIDADPLTSLIMQYRKDRRRDLRTKFANASDPDVWQYHIEARVYPLLFGFGGRFKQDMGAAIKAAEAEIDVICRAMESELHEFGADVPTWLRSVGIPDRWLQAAAAAGLR